MDYNYLNFTVQERNDNTALIFTDTTVQGSLLTGWRYLTTNFNSGADEPSELLDLTLDITLTTSDNEEVVYDQIDLMSMPEFAAMDSWSDLVFTIDSTVLKVSNVAIGTATDELPDGIWNFRYVTTNTGTTDDILYSDQTVVIDGQVRNATYELLRAMPTNYEQMLYTNSRDLFEPMFAYTYLTGLNATDKVSKQEELLNQLATLERITENGSENSW